MGVSCSKSMRLVGSGWFKTPSKCSIHLLDCSSVTNVRPSALDRNVGNTRFGQLANNPVHTFGVISVCCFLCLCTLWLYPMSFISSTTLLRFFVLLSVFSILVSLLSGLVHFWSSSVHLSGPTSYRISTSPCWLPFSSPISSLRYLWRRSQTSATAPRDLWNVLELQICSLSPCGNSLMPSVL